MSSVRTFLYYAVCLSGLMVTSYAAAQTAPQPPAVVAIPPVAAPQPVQKPQAKAAVDVKTVWDFIHQKNFPRARDAMAALRKQNPAWVPPADLLQALNQAEIDDARDHKKPRVILSAYKAHTSLFTCPTVSNLWTLADAHIALNDRTEATRIYAWIDMNCDEKVTLATLDEASRKVSREDLKALAVQAAPRITSDAGKEHLKKFASPASKIPAPKTASPAPKQSAGATPKKGIDLKPVAAAFGKDNIRERQRLVEAVTPKITAAHDHGAATQLGWLYFKAHEPENAHRWFGYALVWHADEDALKGAMLSAALMGNWSEIDKLSAKYAKLIKPGFKQTVGEMFAEASVAALKASDMPLATQYAERASSYGNRDAWADLGWAALNAKHWNDALQAFAKASDSESALTGRAFALQQTGKLGDAEKIACDGAKALAPCSGILSQSGEDAFQAARWEEVQKISNKADKLEVASRSLQMQNAWSFYREGHYGESATLFYALYKERPDSDASDGLVAALKADGHLADAKAMSKTDGGALTQSYNRAASGIF